MKRIVFNKNIETMVYAPPDFNERAQQALNVLPDEWDTAVASPAVVETEDGSGLEYLGVAFSLYNGEMYVKFVVETPESLLDDSIRSDYLDRVRYAFDHPDRTIKVPKTRWRVGS